MMPFKIIENEHKAKIKVFGVGGGGGNAINRMVASGMNGVEFIAVNTDAQALAGSSADACICIGESVTRGLGAGAKPELGRQAIEEDREKIAEKLADTDLVFITAGMGGGTGTGAAPVVAEIAKKQGVLTVGIVTEPFQFEGVPRMRNAMAGINELQEHVDTLIVIKNQRLLQVCSKDTTLEDAFIKADEVLLQATRGIADLITIPGMINLDFNDVRTIISEGGDAIMGVGSHRGENRAVEAARKAIKSPLLEEVSIEGAKGVLINISAGSNLTLFEVNEAASVILEAAGPEANIIFGTVIDDSLVDEILVTVIATGFSLHREFRSERRNREEKSRSRDDRKLMPLRPHVSRNGAGQKEDAPAEAAPEQQERAAGSGWRKIELDYPAILRKIKAS
ncbi:MAG: cell division protein FtsZ [Candidatus Latescibacteria bacterium]|nr:cell division protein FtsZ [Candidatus Latescibacterota bacterium]